MNQDGLSPNASPTPPTASIESPFISHPRLSLSLRLGRIGTVAYSLGVGATSLISIGSGVGAALTLSLQGMQLLAFLMFVVAYALWFLRGGKAGTISVANRSLVIDRGGAREVIPADQIDSAFVQFHPPAPIPSLEVLLRDGNVLSCRVPDYATGDALAKALGFGPGQKRTRIPLTTPRRRLLHLLLGLVSMYLGTFVQLASLVARFATEDRFPRPSDGSPLIVILGAVVATAVTLGSYAFLRRLERPPEITIGDDGIRYLSGPKTRFLARADIGQVDIPDTPWMAVTIHARGEPLRLAGVAIDEGRRTAAGFLIRERLAAAPQAKSGVFSRQGRSLGAWRSHIRQLLDSTYRAQGASLDDAESVLRSANAADDERIGAALALRIAGAEPARVRIAADASARDELREALMAVSDEQDDHVLEAKLQRAKI